MKPREPWVAGAVWCARALLIALLFTHPIQSWGSVSYIASSASALSTSSVSSITITAPVGLATGDVLIAMVGQSVGVLPIVKTVPAGWTLVLEVDDTQSSGVSVYSRVTTSADVAGTTYTWTFKGSALSGGEMLDFRGVLSTSPVITSASTLNATSVDYTAPSITPGIPNTELVVLFAADNGGGGMNSPTAMTKAFVGASGTSPTGYIIGAFVEALAASTATGTLQSKTNNTAGSIGISLALQAAPVATPDHFAISDLSTAVNCQASPVTITAHSASHAAVSTTSTITVSTSTAHGDWSLAAGGGSGSFTPGAANGGTATYTYVTADGGAVILLLKDTYVETVTINVAAGSVTQKSGNANSSEQPPLTFVASGFRITNGSNIAATIVTQIAAKSSTQSLALQAVRTDNNGACTAAFASGATVNVSLAYQCNNPTSCVAGQTFGITNNSITTNIASNANGSVSTYTTVPLKFSTANAEAPFSFSYSDVGQVTLYALYFIPLGSGSPSANSITGSSQFVVQPSNFSLTNIKCTTFGAGTCSTLLSAPGNNPGATSAAGTAFIQAGQAFSTTVTARNFAGAATPNYGQEIAPPSGVTLSANLILPVGGNAATLNNASAFGSFSAGVATGTTFNWPEVGIITLTPTVASYLGSGAVTGTASGDIGRFIPNAFSTAPNTPLFGTGCPNAVAPFGFSYLGQPLTYTVPPVLTVTALSAAGSTARNYTGAFLKMTNSTLTGRTYAPTPVSPALDSSGLPSTTADPVIVDLGSGQAKLTFSTGTGLLFTRGAAVAPFSANIALSINVIDSDGAAAPNPVSIGSAGGIGFSTSPTQYYGRLALRDAVGSELLDLPMALTTQYYLSTTQGFTTNTIDNCTTLAAPSIAFSKFLVNLTSAQACVRDSGKPGLSGAGCAAAAPVATAFKATASSGNFNLVFAAPGSGFNGAMTVTATAPAWLQYGWNSAVGNTNPAGIGAFGVFSGQASRVYQREVY
jgi:MSHA biogenesis protein MshQ